MLSPTELVSRVGTGGRLVVFFKAVCVYFAVGGAAPAAPPALTVVTKCAPILCLLALVLLQAHNERRKYARLVGAGLALSAVGDALLVWPHPHFFVAGMIAFGAAHVAYLTAFSCERQWCHGLTALFLAVICYGPSGACLMLLDPPGVFRVLVPLYGVLLATMCWRALVSAPRTAGVGSLLFMVSDAILGYNMFGGPVPYKQVLVMCSYYLAQLGIAFSALTSPEAKVQKQALQ